MTPAQKNKFRNHEKYRFNKGYTFNIVDGTPVHHADVEGVEGLVTKNCRIHKISKGNGKFRIIYAPNFAYKEYLRKVNKDLQSQLLAEDPQGIMTAFRNNVNVVTNAKKHIGFKYTMKVDLFNFFDCVKSEMVSEYDVPSYCFINGVPRQGLPTSPMVASLAIVKIMYKLRDALFNADMGKISLTVYADDITVSFNTRTDYERIKEMVYFYIKEAKLKINYRKTKLLFGHKNNMRRIICGISVGAKDVRRSRETKMRVRTAIHKNEDPSMIAGLLQWESCKEPNPAKQVYREEYHQTFYETRTNSRGNQYRVKLR